jgi:hypothetical protein
MTAREATLHVPEKAVLSTKETWEYVGGRPFFERLLADYPKLLVPIRRFSPGVCARGKTQYLRIIVDQTLKAAQMEQRYVSK